MDERVSERAAILIKGLLCREPRIRLGASRKDAEEIKNHPFFSEIDWKALAERKVDPPFCPTAVANSEKENSSRNSQEAGDENNAEYEWFTYVGSGSKTLEREEISKDQSFYP